jgi:PKD repeat protein
MNKKYLFSLLAVCLLTLKVSFSQIVSITPNNTSYCSGTNIQVDIVVALPFNAGNNFTLELSDNLGGFSNPTVLGSIVATTNATINGNLPSSISTGTEYRVRVTSSNVASVSPLSNPITINPTTTVSLANTNLCSNTNGVPFTSFPSGGTYSGSAGAIGGFFYPQLVSPGNYTIVYTTAANGCPNTASISVSVNELPNFSLNQTGNVPLCQGSSINLIATSTDAGLSYSWQPASVNNDTLVVSTEGTYSVVATNAFGCSSVSSTVSVTLSNAPANFGIISPNEICLDADPILLSGVPSGGNFSGSNIIGGFFYPSIIGANSITYSYTNSAGCEFSTTANINVNSLPVVGFQVVAPICYDVNSVDLSGFVSPSGGVFSGLGVSSQGLFNPTLSGFGIFPITYSVTNASNCSAEATQTVSVLQTPVSSLDIPLSSICIGSDSILLSGGLPLGGVYSGSGVNNGYFYPSTSLGYSTITYTVSNDGNCPAFSIDSILVYNLSVDAGQDILVNCGAPAQLNATSNSTLDLTYNWSSAQSLSNAFISNPIASPTSQTTYSVSISDGSCSATDQIIVSVGPSNFGLEFSSINTISTPPFNVTFTNNTSGISSYNFIWDFGDGNSINSNSVSVNHQYLFNGTYNVTLIAQNILTGCLDTLIKPNWITTSNGCTHTAIINQTGPITACLGDSVLLSVSTDAISPLYQWNLNGLPISGQPNNNFYPNQSGVYSVTVFSQTGCPQTSLSIEVTFNALPAAPTITQIGTVPFCFGQGSVDLQASSGFLSYIWELDNSSFGIGQTITALTSGFYSVKGIGLNGCQSNATVFGLNASYLSPPEMCTITVDTTAQYWNKNVITWQKPITQTIESYFIYRESNIQNVFELIAEVPYSSLSEYVDVGVGINPQARAYRYRMAVKDTCGSWSLPGSIHKTIHLSVSQGLNGTINLLWNNYEGVQFNSYQVVRSTKAIGAETNEIIQTIAQSSTLNTFTDLAPNSDTLYYKINMVFPTGYTCEATNMVASVLAQRRKTNSNVGSNQIFTGEIPIDAGIRQNEIFAERLMVYPNPNSGQFRIEFNANGSQTGEVKVFDLLGNLVKRNDYHFSKGENSKVIFAEELSNGIYMIQLNFGGSVLQQKIIVQH